MQWHAITVPATALFQDARKEEDTDLESARTVSEPDQDFKDARSWQPPLTRTPVSPGLVCQRD